MFQPLTIIAFWNIQSSVFMYAYALSVTGTLSPCKQKVKLKRYIHVTGLTGWGILLCLAVAFRGLFEGIYSNLNADA